jgi:hypothetical protein
MIISFLEARLMASVGSRGGIPPTMRARASSNHPAPKRSTTTTIPSIAKEAKTAAAATTSVRLQHPLPVNTAKRNTLITLDVDDNSRSWLEQMKDIVMISTSITIDVLLDMIMSYIQTPVGIFITATPLSQR